MQVQTDRYNTSVPVPLDIEYAWELLFISGILLLAAMYFSGVSRHALSFNLKSLFSAVVRAAASRGESIFWLVWALIGFGSICMFTAIVVLLGIVWFQ